MRGGNNHSLKLSAEDRERRICHILSVLVGDDKTSHQISLVTPYPVTSVKNILSNLKQGGYVASDPPVCDHHGWVRWVVTPMGQERARRFEEEHGPGCYGRFAIDAWNRRRTE